MDHLYFDLGSYASGARFEVEFSGSTARICLMESDEYQAYLDEDEDGYEAFGGFYNESPIVLDVPYDGYWYLVVDSNPHRIKVRYTQIFD